MTSMPRRQCPLCGGRRVVPIVYGEPVPATMRAAELGLLLTWGCLVDGAFPRWSCVACSHWSARLDDAEAAAWNGAISAAMRQAGLHTG